MTHNNQMPGVYPWWVEAPTALTRKRVHQCPDLAEAQFQNRMLHATNRKLLKHTHEVGLLEAQRAQRRDAQYQHTIAQLQAECKRLEQAATETGKPQNLATSSEITQLKQRQKNQDTLLHEAQAERTKLQEQLKTARQNHLTEEHTLRDRLKQTEAALTKAKETLLAYEDDRDTTAKNNQATVMKLSAQIRKLESNITESNEERRTLDTQAKQAQAQVAELVVKIEGLEAKLASKGDATTDESALRAKIRDLEANLADCHAERLTEETATAEHISKFHALETKYNSAQEALETAQTELVEMKEAKENIERDLEEARLKLEERNNNAFVLLDNEFEPSDNEHVEAEKEPEEF